LPQSFEFGIFFRRQGSWALPPSYL
jgi:hypothetical protein